MRDIVLCFLQKNSALPVCQKNETRQDADKKFKEEENRLPDVGFFLAKTFFKLLCLIVIAFRKTNATCFIDKQ